MVPGLKNNIMCKLIKEYQNNNNKIEIYRFDILAGMQFTYPGTRKDKLHTIGHYDVELIYNNIGELISQKTLKKVIYE